MQTIISGCKDDSTTGKKEYLTVCCLFSHFHDTLSGAKKSFKLINTLTFSSTVNFSIIKEILNQFSPISPYAPPIPVVISTEQLTSRIYQIGYIKYTNSLQSKRWKLRSEENTTHFECIHTHTFLPPHCAANWRQIPPQSAIAYSEVGLLVLYTSAFLGPALSTIWETTFLIRFLENLVHSFLTFTQFSLQIFKITS